VIRRYRRSDLDSIIELFHDTIHAINARDYSQEQLNAWAPKNINRNSWHERFSSSITYVAAENDIIVGFGNLTDDGWIDMLYTHKDHQRKGIASAILLKLMEDAKSSGFTTLHTEASIVAEPLFEAYGFRLEKELAKIYNGSFFKNFVMTKELTE